MIAIIIHVHLTNIKRLGLIGEMVEVFQILEEDSSMMIIWSLFHEKIVLQQPSLVAVVLILTVAIYRCHCIIIASWNMV